MPIDERWDHLTSLDWDAFGRSWIDEIRAGPSSDVGLSVVMMNFTARPEHQWQFILAAVRHAASDQEFGHIAAGPIEHLLGWHGEQFVDEMERQAETDPQFARVLLGVHKYMMADDVWARVQALKAKYAEPGASSHDRS